MSNIAQRLGLLMYITGITLLFHTQTWIDRLLMIFVMVVGGVLFVASMPTPAHELPPLDLNENLSKRRKR